MHPKLLKEVDASQITEANLLPLANLHSLIQVSFSVTVDGFRSSEAEGLLGTDTKVTQAGVRELGTCRQQEQVPKEQ